MLIDFTKLNTKSMLYLMYTDYRREMLWCSGITFSTLGSILL